MLACKRVLRREVPVLVADALGIGPALHGVLHLLHTLGTLPVDLELGLPLLALPGALDLVHPLLALRLLPAPQLAVDTLLALQLAAAPQLAVDTLLADKIVRPLWLLLLRP